MKSAPETNDTELTAGQQRLMILDTFLDPDQDTATFMALLDHCRIDLSLCNGDAKLLKKIIPAHYRLPKGKGGKGRYDLDRLAQDLTTFPPVAAQIEKLKKRRAAHAAKR